MPDIVIYGRGKTGQSLAKLVASQGKDYVFYDDKNAFDAGGQFTPGTMVLLSPGVKPNSQGMRMAKQAGANIVGELQYCFPLCQAPCISVTGTNGKTTTCELIHHILNFAGKKSHLLGNGGVPFAEKVTSCQRQEVVVLESSSFQLNYCNNFSPKVSLLTNLAADHLDYHQTIGNYSLAKQNNFVHQKDDDVAIFNADDKNAMALAQKSKCRTLFYSVSNSFANCYIHNKFVHLKTGVDHQIAQSKVLDKMYLHNQSNCLGAILACSIFGVNLQQSLQAISTFRFLPHRMQVLSTFCGVTFVDDSKGTNMHATISACQSIKGNVALILGGSNKGYQFNAIFQSLPSTISYICASGQTATEIAICAEKYGVSVQVFDDFSQCIKACFEYLKPIGGTVLMSNACASFDKFSGYEQRGNYFQQVVGELEIESQV